MWGGKRVPIERLVITRDAHTHLLPGVDDGEFSARTAAVALTRMYARGTRSVWLTPHIMMGVWDNTPGDLRRAMEDFRLSLSPTVAGDGLEMVGETNPTTVASPTLPDLYLGAEYMIDENLMPILRDPDNEILTLPEGRVLVEMSWWTMAPQLFDVVETLSGRGLVAVLAHPERYGYMIEDIAMFERLHEAGCEFQLDLAAATSSGKGSPRIINYLMERGWYTHVGSDIHSPRHLDRILDASIDEKTALAGEASSLWHLS
jgi:tyrosine-protein phosphatase YwqE